MEISAKELRIHPGKIIEQVKHGFDIILTFRGKRLAKIVPFDQEQILPEQNTDEIFGLWENHELNVTVDAQVRRIRKGRKF
ncbi:MAG: type II toxin-antitoxin system prevent-host-death family antitoxin [Candidatus Margulisiibacteriota bacterium]